jgi:tetratricopeptide (TPR) repeat protein
MGYSEKVVALRRELDAARAPTQRARLCIMLGRESEGIDRRAATAWFRQALTDAPRHAEALYALARLYESNRQWKELMAALAELLVVERDANARSLIHFRIGSVYEAIFRDETSAVRHYEAAARLGQSMPALHGLRDIYRRRGNWRRVLRTLGQELPLWKTPRERADLLSTMGDIYFKHTGRADRAAAFWRQAQREDATSVRARSRLASLDSPVPGKVR